MPGHTAGNFLVSVIECVYHKKQEYIWFRGGSEWLLRYKDFKNWLGLCMFLGQPLSPSNFLQNFISIYMSRDM